MAYWVGSGLPRTSRAVAGQILPSGTGQSLPREAGQPQEEAEDWSPWGDSLSDTGFNLGQFCQPHGRGVGRAADRPEGPAREGATGPPPVVRVRRGAPADRGVQGLGVAAPSRSRNGGAGDRMRRSEVEGLTWDRVDLSRGVLRLELTKSGRRREVPMRQRVCDVLVGRPGPREGASGRKGVPAPASRPPWMPRSWMPRSGSMTAAITLSAGS